VKLSLGFISYWVWILFFIGAALIVTSVRAMMKVSQGRLAERFLKLCILIGAGLIGYAGYLMNLALKLPPK